MPRAQSSQPTQFEAMSKIQPPKTSVQSQSQYSYNEARAGYVERPHGDYAAFARLIRGFGDEAQRALNAYADRRIDEEVAKGRELYAENPDLDKNKRNWKDYAEEHPDDISRFWSPFLQRGYEEARLKCLSMDEKKAMDEAFMQSELVNETDPQKVADWQQKFVQDFRKEHQLDKYEDKIMLAKNFSPLEFANRQELLQRHTQIVVAQREQKLAEMQTQLAHNELDVAFGGRRIMDGDAALVANVIMKNCEIARGNGVLDKNIPEMQWNALAAYYEKNKRNGSILKAADLIMTPNGTKLSAMPGIQKKINDAEEQRIAKARSDTIFNRQMEEYARKDHARKMQGVIIDGIQNDKPITIESLQQAGARPEEIAPLLELKVKLDKARVAARVSDPNNVPMMLAATLKFDSGEWDEKDVAKLAADNQWDWPTTKDMLGRVKEAQKEENKNISASIKSVFSQVMKGLGNSDISFESITNAATSGVKIEEKVMQGLSAAITAQSKFNDFVADYKKKHEGRVPSKIELTMQEAKITQEVLADMKAQLGNNGPSISVPNAAGGPVNTATGVSPKVNSFLEQHGINASALGLTSDEAVYRHLKGLNNPALSAEFMSQFYKK